MLKKLLLGILILSNIFAFTVKNCDTDEVQLNMNANGDFNVSVGNTTIEKGYINTANSGGYFNIAPKDINTSYALMVGGNMYIEGNLTVDGKLNYGNYIKIDNAEGEEEDKEYKIYVKLKEALDHDVNFKYKTIEATAKDGDDYEGKNDESATIKAGDTSVALTVKIKEDDIYEGDPSKYKEHFDVQIYDIDDDELVVSRDTAHFWIADDDDPPQISIDSDESEYENDKAFFTIKLDKESGVDAYVDINLTHDTTDDNDFEDDKLSTTRVKISAGEKSADVRVNVKDDDETEPDENYYIEISNPKDCKIDDDNKKKKGTIKNDDKPELNIETSKSIKETNDDQTLSVKVTLSEAVSDDVTFKLKTADGSGDDGALADEDYEAIDKKFTIKAGETETTIDITIKGDTAYEYDDKFTATISDPSDNAKIGSDDTCNITIENDDEKPTIKVKDDVSASEDTDPDFEVDLSEKAGVDVTFHIKMSHDTTDDDDFEGDSPIDADYTIKKGDTSTKVNVDVKDDDDDEDDEDYYFEITDAKNATIDNDNKKKKGTIEDNDSSGWWSDKRLKTDIKVLNNAMEKLLKIRGVEFHWKNKKWTHKKRFGVIAQELQKIYPEMVEKGKDGYYRVNYQALIPVLIEATKELKKENDKLKKRLDSIEKRLDRLEK